MAPQDVLKRFRVDFTKATPSSEISWDMTFATLSEAREASEEFVDDHDADEAALSELGSDTYQVYCDGEWDEFPGGSR